MKTTPRAAAPDSRKEGTMNDNKLTILYERLSHEDGRENESLSIEHQKEYLEEYATRNGLENASKLLDGMKQDVENTYKEMTGGKQITEPARSTSIFDGNTSHNFFASQMEKSHRIIDTAQMKLTGQTLNFQ